MSNKNTGEETKLERAEEAKTLDATVDHQRLARLVFEATGPPVESPGQYSAPAPYGSPASASATTTAKKSSFLAIMIVLAVVILLGASYFMLMSRSSLQTNQSTSTNYNKNSKTKVKGSHVAPMMVFIPGGTFQMGRNDGPPQETPAHSVTVKDFFIDNTEVTNAEYAEFVRNTNYALPTDWVGSAPAYGTEQWPVVNVSLNDAMAFAFWRSTRDLVSYRLPTEEEWEYAARNGAKADLFPWGNTWVSDRAVFGLSTPQDVGSLPNGMNQWGAVDLIGNVWEWTSSRASVYQGNPIVFPGKFKDWYVIRGGSYQSQLSAERPITATYRDWLVPSTKHQALGFRLVRSAP